MDDGRIDQIIDKYQGKASALIQILLEIQGEHHWLSKDVLDRVSTRLGVPLSKVQHTVTFFKALSPMPQGRHEIHICNGTSCHVRGSQRLIDAVQELTGIKSGETDPDMKFSLETVTCLGCCGSGPMMVVDGEYYANMAPSEAEGVLKNCD